MNLAGSPLNKQFADYLTRNLNAGKLLQVQVQQLKAGLQAAAAAADAFVKTMVSLNPVGNIIVAGQDATKGNILPPLLACCRCLPPRLPDVR